MTTKTLRGLSDIRNHFIRNDRPVIFVSATCFNLLGMDEWVRRFRFINHLDCFDGEHANVLAPFEVPHAPFTSIEDINNYLLQHKDVVDFIRSRTDGDQRPLALFLMFDEQTEALCEELGLEIAFPSAKLRNEIDDKIMTTRIAERAGIDSVPNVLTPVKDYADLRRLSEHLGNELVIQTAYGDSGHTTFFVSNEDEFNAHADDIIAAPEVKVMKRIRCRGAAQEACVTRHGTIVGPLMTELVGFSELTPYKGGWCGNEVLPDSFTTDVRDEARAMTVAFGEELKKMGYMGYFELDFLRDMDTDKLYLGEVNPRITGASAMTNLASFAHADAPLFLFHLLEYSGIDYELDVEELNARWADPDNIDAWGQLVIKHTTDDIEQVIEAPRSGIWRLLPDGTAEFVRVQTHRRTVESEMEAFFLRITRPGDYFYKGADLGILITPNRLMNDDFELEQRAKRWTQAIRDQFITRTLNSQEPIISAVIAEANHFKML
ncbi:MAG: D-alanine-D-alanine ligase-like ATP-grasp enzyme [Myxococcota bacterium]|jgi:D-alanine-D-alanine ligase-like ATP-grasp enzyme